MIYYFSGTGNSEWAAETIADKLGLVAYSMADHSVGGEREVGLVFPSYFFDLPEFVKNWIRDNDFSDVQSVWAVCTCGGSAGATFAALRDELVQLKYCAELIMPDNSILFAHSEDKIRELLSTAEDRLTDIIEDIKRGAFNADNYTGNIGRKCLTKISVGSMRLLGLNRKKIDDSICIKCGKCVNLCPVKNIAFIDGIGKIDSKCADCFACIHSCPVGAISFGAIKVNDRTRYLHPIRNRK